MQNITPVWLLLTPLGIVLTLLACRWWHGRERQRIEHRLGRIQADRDALQEQVKRARQQVAQLQKEITTWRHASPNTPPAKAAPLAPAEMSISPRRAVDDPASGLVFEPPQLPAHGFADTQPFETDAPRAFARKGA
ncbi:MAG TPA: hypothetical protein VNU71_20160 [Burkholderiaceae bacterium]|nr:hypothetical protein [Burkholderiaceae bacterium]